MHLQFIFSSKNKLEFIFVNFFEYLVRAIFTKTTFWVDLIRPLAYFLLLLFAELEIGELTEANSALNFCS